MGRMSTTGPLMCRSSMMRTASRTVLSGAIKTTGEVITSLAFMAMLHSLRGHRSPCLSFLFDPYQPRHDIRMAWILAKIVVELVRPAPLDRDQRRRSLLASVFQDKELSMN